MPPCLALSINGWIVGKSCPGGVLYLDINKLPHAEETKDPMAPDLLYGPHGSGTVGSKDCTYKN